MPFLELFDETLDINSTGNYELSVQMSRDGLAFTILDTLRNKYILIRSHEPDDNKYLPPDTIDEIISKDDFLTKRYRKVSIIIPSPRFTLVPAPLFDPARKDEYFAFNHLTEESEQVLSNKITEPDAYVLFSIPRQIADLSSRYYPGAHPMHHTKPLMHQLMHHSRSEEGFYVHLHVEREFFNLFIFSGAALKFSNSFNYRNISDVLYYTLNVFKNKGIKNDVTLHFSGMTEKFDDLWSNFAMYIRDIKFTGPSGSFSYSYVFNEIDLHRYINLFTAPVCG